MTPCPAALRGSCQDGPKFAEEATGIRKVQEDFPGSPNWGLSPWELLQEPTLGSSAGVGAGSPVPQLWPRPQWLSTPA